MFENIQHMIYHSNFLLFACTSQYVVFSLANLIRMDNSGSAYEHYSLVAEIILFTIVYVLLILSACLADEDPKKPKKGKEAGTKDDENSDSALYEPLDQTLVFVRVFALAKILLLLNTIFSCLTGSRGDSFVCQSTWPLRWRLVLGFFYIIMSVAIIGSIFAIRSLMTRGNPQNAKKQASRLTTKAYILVSLVVVTRASYLKKFEQTCLEDPDAEAQDNVVWNLQGSHAIDFVVVGSIGLEILCLIGFLGFSTTFDLYADMNHEEISLKNTNFIFRTYQVIAHVIVYVIILFLTSPLSSQNNEVALFILVLAAIFVESIDYIFKWLLFRSDDKATTETANGFFFSNGHFYKAVKAL